MRLRFLVRRGPPACLLPIALAAASPAFAADDPNGVAVDEVVVTAQRRPEAPETVPISLTAVSGADLEARQATEMAALGKVTPSLVMMRTGAFTQPYLRGVGKRSTLGVENSVATYVDGVYLASSISALMDLRGVARVEVLNGPQGTLFGRNSTGGVIQVVTKDPSAVGSAEGELHAGSYGYLRGDLYVTGGVDRLAGNLALSASHNDGYGTNLFTGDKDQGEIAHSYVARGKAVGRPTAGLKLTLAGDYQDVDQDFAQIPVAGYTPVGQPRIMNFRDRDQNASSRYRFHYGGASFRADADLAGLELMSLTAARRMQAEYGGDLDLGPQTLVHTRPNARQEQISQEFQLQSSPSAGVRWLAGLYFIRIDEAYDSTNFQYGGSYSAQRGGRVGQILYDAGGVSSYAAYGQSTWPLGERMSLTAGLRYTIEDRSVRANGQQVYETAPFIRPIPGLPLTTEAPFRNSVTFREPTWRIALDRKLSDAAMAYLSVSRGFQSGGWNLQTPQSPPFGPETLNAVEAGMKFAAEGGRVSADASAFYYDYADLQVSALTPVGSTTTNATSADVYGVDLQARIEMGGATTIAFGAQFLEARFNAFRNALCTDYNTTATVPYAPIACDVTGNRLPFAPRLKFNLSGAHKVLLPDAGVLSFSGSLTSNSGFFAEPDNVVRQQPYTIFDVSMEWRPPGKGPAFRIWAQNLTDAQYYDGLVVYPTGGVLQRPAPPQRLGVTITYGI